MEIDIGVPLHRQTALGVPAAGCGVLAVIRTEMPVHVVQPFPDGLQSEVRAEHLAREGQRVETLGQGLELGAQTQNRGAPRLSDEYAQILAPAVLPVLEGAEAQGQAENEGGHGLPPSELPGGPGGRAQTLENAPQVQASQGGVEEQGTGVTSEAPFAPGGPRQGGGVVRLGRHLGFQRQGRLGGWRRFVGEQGRHPDVGDRSAAARDARGDGPQGESLSAQSAAAGL